MMIVFMCSIIIAGSMIIMKNQRLQLVGDVRKIWGS